MATTSGANSLEEHIRCSVCLEVYTDPHMLKCLHTFCHQCIQGVKQRNHIRCPECRQHTNLKRVKKDFKMDSLIAIITNMSGSGDNPQETVCDACEDSMRPVISFCTNCEDLLCGNCFKAHRGMRLAKDHIVVTFADLQQSKKQKMDKYIKMVRDAETAMDIKCDSYRELISYIQIAEAGQMAEVNRLRQSIIDDVNSHHDSLLSEIRLINRAKIRSLEQQAEMFSETKKQLADKKQFFVDVSQTRDITLLIDTVKNLRDQLEQELAAIHSRLPRLDRNVKSSIQVVKGVDWNPGTSTRIEVPGTAAVPGNEFRHDTQTPGRGLSTDEVTHTAAVGGSESPHHTQSARRGLSTNELGPSCRELNRREIHLRYREVKRVHIKFTPLTLCLFGDELWVGCGDKGVSVFDTDLQPIKQIRNEHLNWVVHVLKANTEVIVCDSQTGLHLLNQRGDYLKQICPGHFSDASVTNNTLLGLEGIKQQIDVYTKSRDSWVKDKRLNLSGYIKGSNEDRLGTTSTCIFVSCFNTHCVRVYSLTGEFLYKTGEWGQDDGLQAGKLSCPFLSDVGSGGQLLLCDSHNHRLQVFDPQARKWHEIQGLGMLQKPWCAGVGHKHLWVGSNLLFKRQLLKYEALGNI